MTSPGPNASRWPIPALLGGMVAGATALVVGVETLSAIGALHPVPLALLGLVGTALVVEPFRRVRGALAPRDLPRPIGIGLLALGSVTLLTALLAPPNTWDSMTYHLPRITHWLDHGSLAFWPTPIERELWQPPFAEYLGLVGYGALGGRDWLANLPQWIAGVGTVLVAAEIAGLLGAGERGRGVAALVAATIPALILQSSSTQTDLLSALWLGIVAWMALSSWERREGRRSAPLWFGAALGLAIGTKGTALPLALPWIAIYLIGNVRTGGRAEAARSAILALVIAAGLNLPHFIRNQTVFGTPFGPASVQTLLRPASLAPGVVAGNALANLSLHFGTPSPDLNHGLEGLVVGAHRALGLDTGEVYPYFGGYRIVDWSTHEDLAGGPIHVMLGLLGLGYAIARWRRLRPIERTAVIGLGLGAIAFAALVRWQPYNGRLHLPLLALAAPLIAVFLVRAGPRIAGFALLALGLVAAPAAVANHTRPLWPALGRGPTPRAASLLVAPRAVTLFNARPELQDGYRGMAEGLAQLGCRRVATFVGYDSWEYPLRALAPRGTSLEHADPARFGGPAGADSSTWCAVVAVDGPPDYGGPAGYRLQRREGGLSLWAPASGATP
ncbi:MAG: ArnT family glycosyltransferase [Gemmatimonadales bacterium]